MPSNPLNKNSECCEKCYHQNGYPVNGVRPTYCKDEFCFCHKPPASCHQQIEEKKDCCKKCSYVDYLPVKKCSEKDCECHSTPTKEIEECGHIKTLKEKEIKYPKGYTCRVCSPTPHQEPQSWEERFDSKFPDVDYGWKNYQLDIPKDYALNPLEIKSFIEKELASLRTRAIQEERARVLTIVDKHIQWKPTEGYSSEEEKGFQKGLQAEAKLLGHDILQIFNDKGE